MLDIRATAGDYIARTCAYLEMVQPKLADTLLPTFAACEVRMVGCNLARPCTAIVQHRAEYFRENNAKYEKFGDKKPFIARNEARPRSKQLELIVNGFNPEQIRT